MRFQTVSEHLLRIFARRWERKRSVMGSNWFWCGILLSCTCVFTRFFLCNHSGTWIYVVNLQFAIKLFHLFFHVLDTFYQLDLLPSNLKLLLSFQVFICSNPVGFLSFFSKIPKSFRPFYALWLSANFHTWETNSF